MNEREVEGGTVVELLLREPEIVAWLVVRPLVGLRAPPQAA
jgi:hypothetical protein